MTALLTALIDKQDTFEIVRDKIGQILLEECAAQQQLAEEDEQDPDLWKFRVYTERNNPWDQWIEELPDGEKYDTSPIVHIAWDTSTDDEKGSDLHSRQKSVATYQIDCYAYGVSEETESGHASGDRLGSLRAQHVAKLVRNILMSAHYTYLDLRSTVSKRWRSGAQSFQPSIDQRPVEHVHAVRVSMRVEFNEFSPQVEGETLETISVGVRRRSDGLLYLTANFPETEP
jgi:hypothetical protein